MHNMKKPSAELITEWYEKLKDSGFVDQEYFNEYMSPRDMLKRECSKQVNLWINKFTSTEQHYILARSYIHHGKFDNKIDKKVWSLYAEGMSYSKIQDKLRLKKSQVSEIINKYKEKLKDYAVNEYQDGIDEETVA